MIPAQNLEEILPTTVQKRFQEDSIPFTKQTAFYKLSTVDLFYTTNTRSFSQSCSATTAFSPRIHTIVVYTSSAESNITKSTTKRQKVNKIATDSPFKSDLETKTEKEEEKLAKKKIRLDLKERLKTKETTTKSSVTAKRKNVKNKTLKKPKNDENDYYCPLCGEK